MHQPLSIRRLAENEAYFRQQNEQVEERLNKMKEVAAEEGKSVVLPEISRTLFHFYCECSNEDCKQRIGLTLDDYIKIHRRRDQFVIMPGHEVSSIEQIVRKESHFWVVQKVVYVPEAVDHLQATNIDNS